VIARAKVALIPIKKLHIFDAIHELENSRKKVAKLMIKTLYNMVDHAKQRDFNVLRLWVHGCIIGKTQRYKGVRYQAKGRGFREKRDFCQVKVILYEKPEQEFLEEVATGRAAPGVANVLRFGLREDSDYKTLSSFTGITTSKGRQQARLIFKRKVDRQMRENEEQNTFEPRKLIEEKLRS